MSINIQTSKLLHEYTEEKPYSIIHRLALIFHAVRCDTQLNDW